jgi:hypothetical protein
MCMRELTVICRLIGKLTSSIARYHYSSQLCLRCRIVARLGVCYRRTVVLLLVNVQPDLGLVYC